MPAQSEEPQFALILTRLETCGKYDEAVGDNRYGNPEVFYAGHYEEVLGVGLVGAAQARTHRALERRLGENRHFSRVLEVGAGSGEHFPFVQHSFDEYIETDIRERSDNPGPPDERRKYVVADAEALQFPDQSFDRVIATCLLLHLAEPEVALEEWRRVTCTDGLVNLLVPCDPGMLVRATRSILTVPAVKRSGFEGYKLFNARDHRNHVGSIDQLVRYVFRDDDIRTYRYPLRFPSWNLNAFFAYSIRVKRTNDSLASV